MNPEFNNRSVLAPARIVLASPASRLPWAPVTPALRGPEPKHSGHAGHSGNVESKEQSQDDSASAGPPLAASWRTHDRSIQLAVYTPMQRICVLQRRSENGPGRPLHGVYHY
jgi:hypothetical protein